MASSWCDALAQRSHTDARREIGSYRLRVGLLLIAVTLLTACGAGATPTPAPLSSASPVPATAPTTSPTHPPRSTATATPPALILESLAQIGGTSRAVTLQGRYAYLNVGLRLVILDIADPARLALAGRSAPLPAFEGLAVAGAHAYVAAGTGGLCLLGHQA